MRMKLFWKKIRENDGAFLETGYEEGGIIEFIRPEECTQKDILEKGT